MPLNSQLRPEEEAPRQRKGADRHRKPKLALATSADGLSESMNPTPPNVDYSDSEHSRHSSVDGRLFDSLPTSTATTPSRGDPRASSPQRPKSSLLSERSDSPARAQMAASAAQADISAAEPAARAESSAHVPGITLTRSESDQVRLGVRGDVRLATEQQGVIEEEVADVSPSVTEPPAVERPAESATAASPQLKTTPPRDTAPSSVTPSSIEPASRPTSVKKKKKSKTGEETSSKKKSKKKSEGAADDGESVKSASSSKKKVKRSKSSKTLANPTLVEDAQQPGATLEIISPSRPAKSSSLTRSASMGAASPHVLSQSKGSARSSTSPMRTSASVASIASAPSVAPSTAPPPLPVFEIPKAPPSQNPDKPKSGLSRSLSSLSPKKKRNSVLGLADDVSRAAQHDRSASSPLASPATSRPASPSPSLPARPKAKPAAQPLARSPSLIQASPRPAQAKAKPAAPRPASLVSPSPSGTSISTSPGSSPVVRPQPVPRQQAVRPVSVASLPTATQGVASTSQGSSAHTSPATSVKGVVVGAAALGTGTADSSIFGRLNATEADRRRTRSDVGRPMSMMSLPAQSVAMPDSLLPDGGLNAGGTIRPRAMSLLNEPVAHSSHSAPPRELPTAADFRPTNDVRNVVMMGSTRLEKANLTCMRALILASSTSAALRRRSPLASVFGRSAPHVEAFRYDRDLEFSPRQSLPSQLKPNEALIGVLAGAIDEHDMAWTSRMSTIAQGFGWIPGRSFCGKVVEAGFEVSKVKRGDFVYGYTELDKVGVEGSHAGATADHLVQSGALSEMVVANSDNLALAPTSGISVEQIATLPAPGVYACQIMESICSDLPKGSKVCDLLSSSSSVLLNEDAGPRSFCARGRRQPLPAIRSVPCRQSMLLRLLLMTAIPAFHFRHTRDLWMVAQCPPDVVDGEDFCRATGASDVIVDEPLAALNSVHESSFDVVIDTIGGRRLYDAARRVLHYNATYITCVGDELIPNPSASDHWKVGVRSLRRAFVKKDKKVINYWSINFDQRELPRESLDKLRAAVDAGLVRPVVRRVLQLPEAAAAFEPGTGGNKVVRIADTI